MTTDFCARRGYHRSRVQTSTEVTYLGAVYGTMAALRRVLPRNEGRIIQVGSALAYRSISLQAAYCGAKHAIAFTDSLRTEFIHDGKNIHLKMVQLPGDEHASVHLVPFENAELSPARAADLPA